MKIYIIVFVYLEGFKCVFYNSIVIYFIIIIKKLIKKVFLKFIFYFYKLYYYIYKNKIVKGYYNILLELLSGKLSFECESKVYVFIGLKFYVYKINLLTESYKKTRYFLEGVIREYFFVVKLTEE
ncbi:Uncharacterised protein [Clostridioides difficile]|nr:Uncharacterised protein [Clostridioides difficile]